MSEESIYEPPVPWSLTELLAEGPAPLSERPVRDPYDLDIVVILPPGAETASAAGVPEQFLEAMDRQGAEVTVLSWEEADDAADADVILAGGWGAAPEVLRVQGARARAVLATPEPAPLVELGWTEGLHVIAPAWLGGTLAAAADERYMPQPDHRRDDVVHIHGINELMLLVAAELAERRPQLELVVSGVPFPISLPFTATGIEGGASEIARAFALATVGLAPAVRGWRPVATAMAACGLPVVTADTPAARLALGDACGLVATPAAGADAVEALLDDLVLRAERSRAGMEQVSNWDAVADDAVSELRAL